jgi:hypothetical protein
MNNRFFRLIALFLFVIISKPGFSDEGMWIPMFLKELNEDEMKAMGMKLTAEDIYSINKASMKDAVVLYGRGCTGEIVSDKGLMLTNHHCGYGRVQAHSTVDNDLLSNGFWAYSLKEELPNPGLEASILVYMKEVTDEVMDGVDKLTTKSLKDKKIEQNISKIMKDATKDNHYTAKVVPFYYGNQYILMVYEVFKDIRLVGAPPSSIGKFGGDTDNWMWPRHTGDFAWFRIYADKDNKPAAYSEDNVPYTPKYSFSISLKGVEEGDFTFVFGYPGRTNQYATSHAIEMITKDENPVSIEMRRMRMDVMEKYMEQSDEMRIQYSAKHAGVANFWKKMIGENRGVRKTKGIEKKKELESRFVQWVKDDAERTKNYGNLIDEFEKLYEQLKPASFAATVFFEGGYSIEMIRCALQFNQLYLMSTQEQINDEQIQTEIVRIKSFLEGFYKDYSVLIDQETAVLMLPFYYRVDEKYAPEFLNRVEKNFKANMQAFVSHLFKNSMFVSKEKTLAFLEKYNPKKDAAKLAKDPGFMLMSELIANYRAALAQTDDIEARLDEMYKIYVKALMEMDTHKRFYPDANSTLRVSYGNVSSFIPFDAVIYNYYTTTDGIVDKTYEDYPDYIIEDKLYKFLTAGDFGEYVHSDGSMRVAFVATNHTTGGNSGSPVLNADGHLVGINFDRVWEGTMSDLFYDVSFCRNISVDIRYVLLITDKFAGATNLIDELKLVR